MIDPRFQCELCGALMEKRTCTGIDPLGRSLPFCNDNCRRDYYLAIIAFNI